MIRIIALTALALLAAPAAAQEAPSFFVTSAGPGKGGDLGGLAGADAHCASLAQAAGLATPEGRQWRAYLSTSTENARDRIGAGPWVNVKGEVIAESVEALHSDANAISKQTALNEKGETVSGRGDQPNRHDILTGSNPDGTAAAQTCEDWTASGEGSAMVGHHDRIGLNDTAPAKSWNASHPSRGCSQDALKGTGGDGLLYCFAAN